MQTVDAVFENGMLRPLSPIDVAEGTVLRVEVPESGSGTIVDEPVAHGAYDHEATMRALDAIIAMPLENDEPFSGEDHDETLYGWKRSK